MRGGPAALVVVLGVAISCSSQIGPAPSRAAPMVRSPAATVILQAADVPSDYRMDKDEAMSPDDLANGLGTTPAVLKQRVASGYVRSFTKDADPFVCCVIDSILISTADANAAQLTFREFRTRALDLGSIETDLGERLGELSTAFVFQESTADHVLFTITVLFRYANVVDAVEVTGRSGSFERAYVLELAKKQFERLRADAERH